MQVRPISVASTIAVFAAACLWGLAAASTWACIDPHAIPIEVGAATATTAIAAVTWSTRARMLAERDRLVLIRTLSVAVPAQERAPEEALRAVSSR